MLNVKRLAAWSGYRTFSPRVLLQVLVGVGSLALLLIILSKLPDDPNWTGSFYPAGRAILEGHNPYATHGFFNPPWLLLLLAPLTLLPEQVGRLVLVAMAFAAYLYLIHRAAASRRAVTAFLLSFPVLFTAVEVNLDSFVLMGLLLAGQLGLFLLMLKPQAGVGIALFWLVEAWRAGGWRKVVRLFAPIVVAFLLSFTLFGNWFVSAGYLQSSSWNTSPFPFAVPVGLGLIAHALRRRDIRFAIPASLCFSPYVGLGSWSLALYPLVQEETALIAVSAGTWLTFGISSIAFYLSH